MQPTVAASRANAPDVGGPERSNQVPGLRRSVCDNRGLRFVVVSLLFAMLVCSGDPLTISPSSVTFCGQPGEAISSAPVLLPRHLHLGPEQFAWLFIPAVSGIFFGALAANRIAGRMTFMRQIGIGFAFLISASVCNVLYHLWLPPALPWTVLPLFVYTFGMSIAAPAATLMALDLFPHIRGTVASCQSFETTLLGALVAGVIAPALSHSVLWLSLGQMGFCSLALVLWLTSRYYRSMLLRHPGDKS